MRSVIDAVTEQVEFAAVFLRVRHQFTADRGTPLTRSFTRVPQSLKSVGFIGFRRDGQRTSALKQVARGIPICIKECLPIGANSRVNPSSLHKEKSAGVCG